ncbi:MAG: hypothetical protein ABIH52_02675 [Candidatus Aenigmatarchaeota archaeon]|nr:hypothetical protein [Nanoarchaeota archaeon]
MKKILTLFIIFSFLLTIGFVHAEETVLLEPADDRIITHQNTFVKFIVTATNKQNTEDYFQQIIDGTHLEWTFPSHVQVHLDPLESKKLSLDLYPRYAEPGEYVYKFELISQNTGKKESVPLYLEIKEPFLIEAFDAVNEGDQLKIAFAYDTAVGQELDVFITVKDNNGNVILSKKFVESIEGQQTITRRLDIPGNILAGEYLVEADFIPYLSGTPKSENKVFYVEAIHDVMETENRVLTPLYEEVTVKVTNNGNIEENRYSVYQSVRSDFLTGFITQPEECNQEFGQTTCEYLVNTLPPGTSQEVTYRIEYWPIYLQVGIILIIIISLVGYSFIRVTAPTITKTVKRKGNQKYSVTLHIKNPFRHHLRGVMVRDWISPLADITPEFSMKPVARKSDAGTELLWNIGNIRPKDEVLINYTLKTQIEGNIKLPKAHVRFFDKQGSQNKIFSSPVMIK